MPPAGFSIEWAVLPDSQRERQRSLQRRSLVLALLLAGTGLGAYWWSVRPQGSAPFTYLHGHLNAPPSDGQVVFRLNGVNGARSFTLAQLEALPAVRYRATQPQLKRSFTYTGVPLRDLAALAGLDGQNLRVSGNDQFAATVQASDYQTYPVMLAYLADDQPMTAVQKGPLQVVFPNDEHPDRFPTLNYGSQWVWFAAGLGAAP